MQPHVSIGLSLRKRKTPTYLQIMWQNDDLGYPLNGLFFLLKAERIAETLYKFILCVIQKFHRDTCSSITSGPFLKLLGKTSLKQYFEYLSENSMNKKLASVMSNDSTSKTSTGSNTPRSKKGSISSMISSGMAGMSTARRRASSGEMTNSFSNFWARPFNTVREMLPNFTPLSMGLFEIPESAEDIEMENYNIHNNGDMLEASTVVEVEEESVKAPEWVGEPSKIITSEKVLIELVKNLPKNFQSEYWRVLYNFEDNGVSLERLFRTIDKTAPTIMIIQPVDTNHCIFGYFATEPWSVLHGKKFYGTGESFLFKVVTTNVEINEANDSELVENLEVFRWTEKNTYYMNSNLDYIAVGSGGDGFALCIDSELEKGTTSSNETYGNKLPLVVNVPQEYAADVVSRKNVSFDIKNFEIICFETSPIARPKPKKRPSFFDHA